MSDVPDRPKLEPLPPLPGRFVRRALAFTVTLGVALAPLLGRYHVPGFSAIAEVLPVNLQKGLLPFASFLLAVPVIAIQFFATDRIAIRKINRMFLVLIPLLIVLPIALYLLYIAYVVQIDFEGGRGSAAYVVGDRMLPDCPCVKHGMDIERCVGHAITASPTEVSDCYPRAVINQRRARLSIAYLLLMLTFGSVIALLVMKESRQTPSRRRR